MTLIKRLTMLLLLEGVALTVLGLVYGGYWLAQSGDQLLAVLAGLSAVLAGLVLVGLSRAIGRGKAWARSPAITLNIFPLPIAFGAISAGAWWVGLLLLLLSGSVLYLFATSELRETFRER